MLNWLCEKENCGVTFCYAMTLFGEKTKLWEKLHYFESISAGAILQKQIVKLVTPLVSPRTGW